MTGIGWLFIYVGLIGLVGGVYHAVRGFIIAGKAFGAGGFFGLIEALLGAGAAVLGIVFLIHGVNLLRYTMRFPPEYWHRMFMH